MCCFLFAHKHEYEIISDEKTTLLKILPETLSACLYKAKTLFRECRKIFLLS